MSSVITMILGSGDPNAVQQARAAVAGFRVVTISDVAESSGGKTQLHGTVLHMSRSKKVTITTKIPGGVAKKAKTELAYHRLVFIRRLRL